MARIRSIKPEFRTSLTVTGWPRDIRLFFVLLWGYLDDQGRGVDEPRLIKADCFPLDDDVTAAVVDEWIDVIAKAGTVVRYKARGHRYLCVPGWAEHQRTQHPKASRIPAPEAGEIVPDDSMIPEDPPESLMRDSGEVHDSLIPEQGAGSREQGDGAGEKTSPSTDADAPDDQKTPGPDRNDRDDVKGLCRLLADLMVENGCKRPPITKDWLDNARLMIDKDGRDPAKAATLIRWAQGNSFWRGNIQSMPTFRTQYDQLRLKALEQWEKQQNGSHPNGNGRQSMDEVVARNAERYREMKAAKRAQEDGQPAVIGEIV